jgi:hypothetical protein
MKYYLRVPKVEENGTRFLDSRKAETGAKKLVSSNFAKILE